MSPEALCHHLCPKILIIGRLRIILSPLCHVMQHSTTEDCLPAVLVSSCLDSVVCKSSTSLNRNTINYSNYSTCSVVGAFDLSFSPTYECRDDDQNQEVSELHGDADHFTLPLCFVLMMKLLL